jgi:hypothetical protein
VAAGAIEGEAGGEPARFASLRTGATATLSPVLSAKFKPEGGSLLSKCGVLAEKANGKYSGSSDLRELF